MADVLFIGNMGWREFAVRRLARLYPALLFFLFCIMVLSAVLGRSELLADWWIYPIFAVNLVVILGARFPVFDHLWSVSLEVQAYVMLALIAVTLSGRGRLIALLIGAIFCFANGLVRTYIAQENPFMVYWRPDVGAAVVFASAFLRLLLKDVRVSPWAISAVFVAANGLMLVTDQPWISATVNGMLLAFVGATAERSSRPILQLLESRPLVLLGAISYSLYIWQQLFMYAHKAGFPLFAALALTFLVSTFSYYRVELPGKAAIVSLWRRNSAIDPA